VLGLQLGKPHHHAYVVEDIATAVEGLHTRLGAGPFFLVENVPLENVRSRGEPAEFVHSSAFGACGEEVIELIQLARLAPARVHERFAGQRPRIQHVAYAVPSESVGEIRSELDARDVPEYLSSQLGALDTTLTMRRCCSVTTSRSTPTSKDCTGSSRWSAAPPRAGTAPSRCAPRPQRDRRRLCRQRRVNRGTDARDA
jgi:hypothetical protein